LQSFAIPDYSQVEQINGTENNYWNSGKDSVLKFGTKDGAEINKVQLFNDKLGNETLLNADEEIIGIYGTQ
jgi:hypothetical protein